MKIAAKLQLLVLGNALVFGGVAGLNTVLLAPVREMKAEVEILDEVQRASANLQIHTGLLLTSPFALQRAPFLEAADGYRKALSNLDTVRAIPRQNPGLEGAFAAFKTLAGFAVEPILQIQILRDRVATLSEKAFLDPSFASARRLRNLPALEREKLTMAFEALNDLETAISDLSNLYPALTRSSEEHRADIQAEIPRIEASVFAGTAALAVVLFIGAMLVSFLITRRIGQSLGSVESSFRQLGSGDFEAKLEVKGSDEFGSLEISFGRLVEQLQALVGLVDSQRRAVQTILDASDQGFFSFGADLTIDPEHSAGCITLFGPHFRQKPVDQLLISDPDQQKEFHQGVALVFSGQANPEVVFSFLESEVAIGNRILSLSWKHLVEGKILCTVSDLTLVKRLESLAAKDEAEKHILINAVTGRRLLPRFYAEADTILATLTFADASLLTSAHLKPLLQSLHTLKGDAGVFGFEMTRKAIHEIEGLIDEALSRPTGRVAFSLLAQILGKAFRTEQQVVSSVLGSSWAVEADTIPVEEKTLRSLIGWFSGRLVAADPGLRKLRSLLMVNLSQMLAHLPRLSYQVAGSMGKQILPWSATGADFSVDPRSWDSLIRVLPHLITNMVDHGIESPDQRESIGKDKRGRIHLEVTRSVTGIVLTLADDGGGISWTEVEAKARERGLVGEEEVSQVVREEWLWSGQLSTRESVSEYSGRGVGLSAVRAEVLRRGGTIALATKPGQGTTFAISLPRGARP